MKKRRGGDVPVWRRSPYLRHVHEQEGQYDGSRHGKPAQDPQAFMDNVSLIDHQPPLMGDGRSELMNSAPTQAQSRAHMRG